MRLRLLPFVAGLGLFLWLLHRIGIAPIGHNLARVGWGFAAVLALEGFVVLLVTLGWSRTLPPPRRVPFGPLLVMRLAGDSVNALLPAAVVGGEALRAGLLSRFLPAAAALGSVGLAAMTQFLAQLIFAGLGATVAPAGDLQPRLRVLGLALLAFVLLFVAMLWRISRASDGDPRRLGRILHRASRIFAKRAPGESFLRDLRRNALTALRERPGDLALSVFFFFCGWLVSVFEVGLIMRLLGTPVRAATALSIAVLLVLIEGAFFFVPGRVGVQEGGLYAIFPALGLQPAGGFALGIVRRLRELVWGLVGLALLSLCRLRREVYAQAEQESIVPAQAVDGRASRRFRTGPLTLEPAIPNSSTLRTPDVDEGVGDLAGAGGHGAGDVDHVVWPVVGALVGQLARDHRALPPPVHDTDALDSLGKPGDREVGKG